MRKGRESTPRAAARESPTGVRMMAAALLETIWVASEVPR